MAEISITCDCNCIDHSSPYGSSKRMKCTGYSATQGCEFCCMKACNAHGYPYRGGGARTLNFYEYDDRRFGYIASNSGRDLSNGGLNLRRR